MEEKMKFFIVGSQRSGTTLLKLILNNHPKIRVFDEFDNDKAYEKIRNNKAFQKKGKKAIGFKVPIWTYRYKYLKKKFPDSKFLFMRRDYKAIANSMLGLKKKGEPWIKRNGVGDLKTSLKGISNKKTRDFFREKTEELLKKEDFLLLAVLCAYVKDYLHNEYLERYPRDIKIVNYHELVKKPKKVISEILDFMGIEWNKKVMEHHKNNLGFSIGKTKNSRKIDTKSLEKWKKDISKKERKRAGFFIHMLNDFVLKS